MIVQVKHLNQNEMKNDPEEKCKTYSIISFTKLDEITPSTTSLNPLTTLVNSQATHEWKNA